MSINEFQRRYQVTCDRCGYSEETTYDPSATNSYGESTVPSQYWGDWEWWGQIGSGTNTRMLCRKCVVELKHWMKGSMFDE